MTARVVGWIRGQRVVLTWDGRELEGPPAALARVDTLIRKADWVGGPDLGLERAPASLQAGDGVVFATMIAAMDQVITLETNYRPDPPPAGGGVVY